MAAIALTSRLGVPLNVMTFGEALDELMPERQRSTNGTAVILSTDADVNSEKYCQDFYAPSCDVIFCRADGRDLEPMQLESMVQFVTLELRILLKHGTWSVSSCSFIGYQHTY